MATRTLLLGALWATSTAATMMPPPPSFDVREATVDGIHNALTTGLTTCRDVVSSFVARVEEVNPSINAVLALNPGALDAADALDERISDGNVTGLPLLCVPVLLKDNYDTSDMPTTGGCRALADLRPRSDAATVAALRRAGAVILGKANLHEMALEGLSVSSLGGQTLNPYDATRTPGGSSGGSGAAVAANLAVLATGSDTVNSLRSPASANSLFSFRPTRGLISRAGVIPISYTQDTVGAMARNPRDLAVALTVMASVGYDPADNATAAVPRSALDRDYTAAVHASRGGARGLAGRRLGLVRGFINDTASGETTPVIDAMHDMVCALRSAGAHVVDVDSAVYNSPAISAAMDVQQMEYRELLDAYLAQPDLDGSFPRSFADLYRPAGGDSYLVIPSEYGYLQNSAVNSTSDPEYFVRQRLITNLTLALESTFRELRLDALIYPEQQNLVVKTGSPSQSGRNGILAALTGSPVVVVPAGFSPPSQDAPVGVPIGMEILGLPWSEHHLLAMAQGVSEIAPVRRMPAAANATVEVKTPYTAMPVITPNVGNISPNYPLGTYQ